MTDFLERLDKAQARLSKMKHIDGVDLGLNHILPLIRECYLDTTDAIIELDERIDDVEQGALGQQTATALATAQATIVEIAATLDAAMSALDGIQSDAKDKIEKDYGNIKVRVGASMVLIAAAIAALDGQSDGDNGDGGGDGDGGDDGGDGDGDGDDQDGEPTTPGKKREASA